MRAGDSPRARPCLATLRYSSNPTKRFSPREAWFVRGGALPKRGLRSESKKRGRSAQRAPLPRVFAAFDTRIRRASGAPRPSSGMPGPRGNVRSKLLALPVILLALRRELPPVMLLVCTGCWASRRLTAIHLPWSLEHLGPVAGSIERALNHYGMGASIGRVEKHELSYGNPSAATFGEVEVAYERLAFGECK